VFSCSKNGFRGKKGGEGREITQEGFHVRSAVGLPLFGEVTLFIIIKDTCIALILV
jgi:hypothetical protein